MHGAAPCVTLVAGHDGAHVEDVAEVVDANVVEAYTKVISYQLHEGDVGPRGRQEDELLP